MKIILETHHDTKLDIYFFIILFNSRQIFSFFSFMYKVYQLQR